MVTSTPFSAASFSWASTEHDFGAFDFIGDRVFWKIDYFDKSLAYGSENPADPEVTERVMTVMLASDY